MSREPEEAIVIERAANGWIVRDGPNEETRLIAADDETEAMLALLADLLEFHGPSSSRYDRERIRVITLPGDKWRDVHAEPCPHTWVERWDYEGETRWWCPCGQSFAPLPRQPEGEGEAGSQ